MKSILVLVDFTDTAEIAVNQAIAIAKIKQAAITICHVSPSVINEVSDELMKNIEPYAEMVRAQGIENKILVGHGELFHEVHEIVKRLDPDLVIVGTHGKVGLKQNLFGSSIYKLVKGIKAPTLVINDKMNGLNGAFKKIMLPVAPNKDYLLIVKQTINLLAKDGEIIIFAILKPGVDLSDEIIENVESSKRFLDKVGVPYTYLQLDSKHYSIGYARDTFDAVKDHNIDLISIMTHVSEVNPYFGSIDKENIILNDLGIPVLCANH